MGLFGSKNDAAAWRAKENDLQEREERSRDEKGQDHPDTRAAYAAIEEHHAAKPLRLRGRS
jgi:hypothetical protein